VPCPSCGFSNEPGEKFCSGCAAPLTVTGHPPEPTFTSPQAYTPKHLAEKILTAKSVLERERKQLTMRFADLEGSMELVADRDPEKARKLLDPVLERMMEGRPSVRGDGQPSDGRWDHNAVRRPPCARVWIA
jgi:hypothetical protein